MSADDITVKAQKIGHHPISSTSLTPVQSYVRYPGGNFMIHDEHSVQTKNRVMVRQAPSTAVNGASFLNGGQVDFKIDRGLLSILNHAYLQIKITNATGAAVTLAPMQLAVDRIEFFAGNGGNILTTVWGQSLYLSNLFMSRDEIEGSFSNFGLAANYATTGDVLAIAASKVYYIPILHLLPAAKLHLAGLNSELTIRVWMQSSAFTILAGAHPTITDTSLILKGYEEPNSVRVGRRAVYNSAHLSLRLPYLNWMNNRDTQALAVSSQYTSILQSIKGVIAGLIITLRPVGFTGATQANYQPVASIDLHLASGESMLGHYVRLHEDFRLEAAETFSNLFNTFKDFYVISFAEDLAGDYATGRNTGYHVFTGTEKLQFTTTATIVPGSFQIDVWALSHEHLNIVKGAVYSAK